jgi:uncharacterized protein
MHGRQAAGLLILAWLLLALAHAAAAAEPAFPPLGGRVVDEAQILSPAAEARLSAQLEAHEKATSNQVVVATLASLQGYDIADYGTRLARQWQIGQGERDNGVVLIVAPNERAVRIEVGYGLEGDLPDAIASNIVQTAILPAFRAGNMEAGVEAGVAAILAAIEGTYEPLPKERTQDGAVPDWIIPLIFVGVWMLIIGGAAYGRRRRGLAPWIIMGGGLGGLGGSGGGRGRSSGFGGGGFRGGGGSFGGGGASGRW